MRKPAVSPAVSPRNPAVSPDVDPEVMAILETFRIATATKTLAQIEASQVRIELSAVLIRKNRTDIVCKINERGDVAPALMFVCHGRKVTIRPTKVEIAAFLQSRGE
ncbi:MAG: hypothetical protein ACOYOF_08095 [Verrucomicrobiaceae bacterium]